MEEMPVDWEDFSTIGKATFVMLVWALTLVLTTLTILVGTLLVWFVSR